MKISIALATYNGEKYIDEQLFSLLNQTRQPDEVIIVDDGSTDSVVQRINDFIRTNQLHNSWKLISNRSNQGVRLAFLEAIRSTTGDIVFLCDQDDIWFPTKIEEMTDLLTENDKIKVLITSETYVDGDGKISNQFEKNRFYNHGRIKKRFFHPVYQSKAFIKLNDSDVLDRRIGLGCASCATQDVIQEFLVRFPACLAINYHSAPLHDKALFLIGQQLNGLYYWDKPLLFYRRHGENYTMKPHTKVVQSKLTGRDGEIEKLIKLCDKYHSLVALSKGTNMEDKILKQLKATNLRLDAIKNRSVSIWLKSLASIDKKNLRLFITSIRDLKYILST